MNEMVEVVIKMPKEKYDKVCNMYETFPAEMKELGLEYIKNGTVLLEGHGRLGDLDELEKRISNFVEHDAHMHDEYTVIRQRFIVDGIRETETIIKADTQNKEAEDIMSYITGATLLSVEEAKNLDKEILKADENWWLASRGYGGCTAAFVHGRGGYVYVDGKLVDASLGVRPALEISDLKSSGYKIGESVYFGGHSFTVISDQYALCDDIIGKYPFRKNWEAKDPNIYEASDVKKFVDNWFEKSKEYPSQETLLKLFEKTKEHPFWETLLKLGAHDALTIETEYFSYRFEKSADSDYIVDVDVFDKNGACVGGTGDLHLEDYLFSEDTLDEEFVEGKGWAKNLIDDDFEHMPFEDFIEGRAQEERE